MPTDYDAFLERVLRRVQPEFAFITLQYAFDFPAELTLALVGALVAEQGLSVRLAAEVVLDFCERRGEQIPELLNRLPDELPEQIQVWH